MPCPDADLLNRFAEGLLSRGQRADLERHLDVCSECRLALATLAATGASSPPAGEPSAPLPGSSLGDGEPQGSVDRSGRRIGSYRLLELLGRGGMGAVYRAVREDDFEKMVALKVVRGDRISEKLREAFAAERRLLARLEHSCIARLYDGGTTDESELYFVMELVERGRPLHLYCAERRLSTRARLTLFLRVCEAVQHAHGHLVVHRDLKPGNILVGADGTPKLVDFGIAKLLHEAGEGTAAATGTILEGLTPAYASPEQVRGDPVSVTTDVYSLGVVLYELLAGRRPYYFDRPDPFEIARVVCEEEPTAPSLAARQPAADRPGVLPPAPTVHADLDAIVLMAMRKEPERRYGSVGELMADVRRHLEGMPVRARPDSRRYRTAKLLQRHRRLVAAVGVVAVTVVAGVAATLHQARRAEINRQHAERRFGEVRALASALLFDIYAAVEPLEGATAARQLIVRHGIEYLDRLALEAEGDPALESELARGYVHMGDVQGYPYDSNLGDIPGAIASYRKAIAINERLLAAGLADVRGELVTAHQRLGDTLMAAGQTLAAADELRRQLELAEGLLAEAPTDTGRQRMVYLARLKAGESLLAAGDASGARARFEQARDIAGSLVGRDPRAPRDLSVALNKLGALRLAGGDAAGGLGLFQEGLRLRRELLVADPHSHVARRDVSVSLGHVADALLAAGDARGALGHVQQVYAIDRQLAADDPANAEPQLDLAYDLGSLADVYDRLGALREAADHCRRAVALLDELARRQPENAEVKAVRALRLVALAALEARVGDQARAEGTWRLAAQRTDEALRADPGNVETRTELADSWLGAAAARAGVRGDTAACTEARRFLARARELGAGGEAPLGRCSSPPSSLATPPRHSQPR